MTRKEEIITTAADTFSAVDAHTEEQFEEIGMLRKAFIRGAEWADTTMIDKACKWLRKELVNFEDYPRMGEELIRDFKKAMED